MDQVLRGILEEMDRLQFATGESFVQMARKLLGELVEKLNADESLCEARNQSKEAMWNKVQPGFMMSGLYSRAYLSQVASGEIPLDEYGYRTVFTKVRLTFEPFAALAAGGSISPFDQRFIETQVNETPESVVPAQGEVRKEMAPVPAAWPVAPTQHERRKSLADLAAIGNSEAMQPEQKQNTVAEAKLCLKELLETKGSPEEVRTTLATVEALLGETEMNTLVVGINARLRAQKQRECTFVQFERWLRTDVATIPVAERPSLEFQRLAIKQATALCVLYLIAANDVDLRTSLLMLRVSRDLLVKADLDAFLAEHGVKFAEFLNWCSDSFTKGFDLGRMPPVALQMKLRASLKKLLLARIQVAGW